VTQAKIETEFGTNKTIVVLIKRGLNELQIPLSEIDNAHQNIFSSLPKAPEQWILNDPNSSFHIAQESSPKSEQIEKTTSGFFGRVNSILEGF